MTFVSKLTPEQWAECRRLRAEGETFASLGRRFGLRPSAVAKRAAKEKWDAKPGRRGAPAGKLTVGSIRPRQSSPGTIDTRHRLARHLYGYLEIRIAMMERHMRKTADAAKNDPDAPQPTYPKQEQETFSALIHSINQVTEMASEPASAANGGRKFINPELTALSDELDADALAEASEKDRRTAQLAEQLAKSVRPA